jgi:hypothetical protein
LGWESVALRKTLSGIRRRRQLAAGLGHQFDTVGVC